jgi:hypothetical protein
MVVRRTMTALHRSGGPLGVRCVSVIVAVLAVASVSGCTTTSQGEPVPATTLKTDTSSSGQELPFAGASKVDNPLDTTRI